MSPHPGTLAEVRRLAGFWQRTRDSRAVSAADAHADQVMLSALGLGIGEVLPFLHRQRPDLDQFLAWIAATVGLPDPVQIARYHAWLDRAPPPDATRALLDAIAAMPPALSVRELAHWDAEGYVVLRGAISRGEAAAAEAALWRALGAHPDDPDSWSGVATEGIWVNLFHHPALEPVRRSARVHKAFAQLWGTADLWPVINRMGFNPPEAAGRAYRGAGMHWDYSLAQPMPFATQALLTLTDTAADQGALRVVPGFHHRLAEWLQTSGGVNPREHRFDAEARPIPAGVGDLVIWHGALPHDASPNRSTRPRLVQYFNMFSADLPPHPDWI